MKTLLIPSQAAEILAISTKQLHALTAAGEIAFIDIGCGGKRPTRRYQADDIEDFISRRRTIHAPASARQTMKSSRRSSAEDLQYQSLDFEKIRDDLRKAKAAKKAVAAAARRASATECQIAKESNIRGVGK